MNTASTIANPRGPQPDTLSNRFAAVAAGLGSLAVNGHVVTPRFGIRQRFVSVVTNARLEPSDLSGEPGVAPGRKAIHDPCHGCERMCVAACPTGAIGEETVTFECEGRRYRFDAIDPRLCDWSKRYALRGASGFAFAGSEVDVDPGPEVTAEKLAGALKQIDPVKKLRPVVAEPCVLRCPYAFST
jgi:ferredoxin